MSQQGPPPWEPGGWSPESASGQPGQPSERPFEQTPWGAPEPPPRQYPRQQLLPQEIKPGRNRTPLYIGLGLAMVLVIGGAVAYLTLRSNGEETRAAYCAALRKLTHNGDLTGAVDGANTSTLDQIKEVRRLAPNAVSDDWSKLWDIAEQAQSGSPDYSQALTAYNALKVIAQDASDKCSLDLNMPLQ